MARADRATRRVVARLYPADEETLDELCARLELSEVEVVRKALHELARQLRVR